LATGLLRSQRDYGRPTATGEGPEVVRLERRVLDLGRAVERQQGVLVDLSRRGQDTEVRRQIEENAPPPEPAVVASSSYAAVDPSQTVFDTFGTGGTGFTGATAVTLALWVPAGRARAWCYCLMRGDRTGGDSDDSELEIQWRRTGGTEWRTLLRYYPLMALVQDSQPELGAQVFLELGGGQTGEVRVRQTYDDWFYTLTLLGYD